MRGWSEVTLGDVVVFQRGFDLPVNDRSGFGHPVIASTGQVGLHSEAQVSAPGVVIGRSGSIGGGQYITEPFWPLNTTLWVKDFKGNDPRFCFYLVKSIDFRGFNAGSGVPTLNRNHIHPLPILCPPVEEQREIAAMLGALDDKIELNRRMNETLEAMARALFKDWFVDFGPTRAKMQRREAYLAREIWDLFPDSLDADGIPNGWKIVSLDHLIQFNPKEKLKKGTCAPYLQMGDLPTSGAIPEKPVLRNFTSGMRFRNGDTLFARITPCLENGKACFVQQLESRVETIGWGSTEFIVMRSRSPIPAPVSYLIARDTSFRNHAIQSMTGTSGRQRARVEALESFPFCCPDVRLWNAFGSIISPIFERIKMNGVEVYPLTQTRDLLLPKLMSGKIRVSDAKTTRKEKT